MELTEKKIKRILKDHEEWLSSAGPQGKRADYSGMNLRGANFVDADLREADFSGTNSRRGNFSGADMRGADLRGANFKDADLRMADLRWSNTKGARFSGADLRGADIDFSCLPIWCGGQFKADARICKQLVAHVLRIMELSEEGSTELRQAMSEYKAGWHREESFDK